MYVPYYQGHPVSSASELLQGHRVSSACRELIAKVNSWCDCVIDMVTLSVMHVGYVPYYQGHPVSSASELLQGHRVSSACRELIAKVNSWCDCVIDMVTLSVMHVGALFPVSCGSDYVIVRIIIIELVEYI